MSEDKYVIVKRVDDNPGFIISWFGRYSFPKEIATPVARYLMSTRYKISTNKRKVSVTYTVEPEGDWIIEKTIMEIRDG